MGCLVDGSGGAYLVPKQRFLRELDEHFVGRTNKSQNPSLQPSELGDD